MSSVNKVLVSFLQLAVIAFARECVLDSDCEQSQQFGRIQAIQVDFFPNQAPLIEPSLSQKFTQDLQDLFIRQNLS